MPLTQLRCANAIRHAGLSRTFRDLIIGELAQLHGLVSMDLSWCTCADAAALFFQWARHTQVPAIHGRGEPVDGDTRSRVRLTGQSWQTASQQRQGTSRAQELMGVEYLADPELIVCHFTSSLRCTASQRQVSLYLQHEQRKIIPKRRPCWTFSSPIHYQNWANRVMRLREN